MRAFICDACKGQYGYYTTKNSGDEIGVENANGITFVQINKNNELSGRGKLELCPSCMEKLQVFIFDELCADDAPFINKIKYYANRKKEFNKENKEANE